MSTPIPNRLMHVPDDIYEHLDRALEGHDQRKMARAVLRMAYRRGYCDGYRDGHTDAENGHDDRVRAVAQ